MSCTIPDKKIQAVTRATEAFMGKAKSFKEIKPGVIQMPINAKFNKNRLYMIALSNADRVTKQMKEHYGEKFSYGWVSIDSTPSDSIIARVHIPNELIQAWNVKLGLKSIEEVNADPNLFARDIEYYRGDRALLEQEHINDEEFYKEFDETFSNFNRKSRYQYDGLEGQYDGSSDWRHDSTKDTNVVITNAELARIKNNRKIC